MGGDSYQSMLPVCRAANVVMGSGLVNHSTGSMRMRLPPAGRHSPCNLPLNALPSCIKR